MKKIIKYGAIAMFFLPLIILTAVNGRFFFKYYISEMTKLMDEKLMI